LRTWSSAPDGALYLGDLHADVVLRVSAPDSQPTLHIAALPRAVRLTWTTNDPGFLRETDNALTLPTGWGVLASNCSGLNTNYAVTNSVEGAAKFYRLHKP